MRLILHVHYPDPYPDTLPGLRLETTEGELEDRECDDLLKQLEAVV